MWQIKTNYTGGDRILEYCLENLKGNKNKLFDYIVIISKPQNCPVKTIDEIKIDVQALSGSVEKIPLIRTLEFGGQVIEEAEIFLKEIVGNKNSSVGKFIEDLGALDKSRANENEYIRKRKQVYKLLETCMNTDLLIFRHRKSTLFMV